MQERREKHKGTFFCRYKDELENNSGGSYFLNPSDITAVPQQHLDVISLYRLDQLAEHYNVYEPLERKGRKSLSRG